MIRFYAVHEKLIQALDGLPRDELGVSDEVREQVLFFSFLIFEGLRRTLQNLLSLFSLASAPFLQFRVSLQISLQFTPQFN